MMIASSTSVDEGLKISLGWKLKRLEEVCQINPRRPKIDREPRQLTSFLPMSGVDEKDGIINKLDIRQYQEVARGYTYFQEHDVLFAKITPCMQNGKSVIANGLIDDIGFGSTEFHVLRSGQEVIPAWIHKFIRRLSFRQEAQKHFKGAVGQQRVSADFIKSSIIPVPPTLDLQKRIVTRIESLLDEIREARRICDLMQRDANQMMRAALNEVIKKLDESCLTFPTIQELVSTRSIRIISGGTPPKDNQSYWSGLIPWISPKEMKSWYVKDTGFHVSQTAIDDKKVKLIPSGSVVIVVRGMILMHTFPVGITHAETTINQDIKALVVNDEFLPEYIGYILRARAPEILGRVEIAGHGTRRLKTDTLKSITIPHLSRDEQQRVVSYLNSIQSDLTSVLELISQDSNTLDLLEQSILERAFRGEL